MAGPATFLVCICTNAEAEAVRPTLAAAARQQQVAGGAEVLVVTSGLSAARHADHVRQAGEFGMSAVAAPAGAAAARNRALAEAPDDGQVAFIDDDVLPAPDWLSRLRARWADADPDVHCIGGMVEPRWAAPPPRWISPRLGTAFALLDLGPGLVELDPARGDGVWTANASFRTGPLREVGGFPEGLGPWRGYSILGEDTAAQRKLNERGGRVLYAGDVRVTHLIPAERMRLRDLVRRELLRGAGDVFAGTEVPGRGALRAARAAAGLAAAVARADRPLAGERLARLARGTGAAGAPLVRRRLRSRGWPG